jgi:hypothetical protein
MGRTRSTTWLIGAIAVLLAGPVGTAHAGPTRVYNVRGTDKERGAFTARITVEELPKGEVLVTRDMVFAEGEPELLVGKGRWTKNRLHAQLRPVTKGIIPAFERTELVYGRRDLTLTIDHESGFCISRTATRTSSSRAQGRAEDAPKEETKSDEDSSTKDAAPSVEDAAPQVDEIAAGEEPEGWAIEVPGDMADAARDDERIYVAAGAAGLQVVDLDTEQVVDALRLPGETTAVTIEHGKISTAVVTTINRGERWVTRVALPALRVLSTTRVDAKPPAKKGGGRRPKGDLHGLRCREGVFALRATEVVQYGPGGNAIARTPLGQSVEAGRLLSVEDGTAVLMIPGRGVVVLDLAPREEAH